MSKFTKGPWEVNGQRPYIIACTDGTNMDKFCIITGGEVSNSNSYYMAEKEINEANAQLISVAPDLYKYSKKVMALLEKHGGSIVGHLLDTDENDGEFLRQAIRKVEGL